MSVELNVADVSFLGDNFTFIDCPGSIEFQHEGALALTGCDAAVVVCEPDPKRVPALQLILKQLEDRGIPRFLFLNKINSFDAQVRDILPTLQPASSRRWCCARSRSGRTASPRASSTWRWSAPSSTARRRNAEVDRDAGHRQGARDARRASRCWSSSPTTTTS